MCISDIHDLIYCIELFAFTASTLMVIEKSNQELEQKLNTQGIEQVNSQRPTLVRPHITNNGRNR